jgi:hypothetical protein
LSHGTCSYIRMYINAVAGSVMLYLQHDFRNIRFKIEHNLYMASGPAPPHPPRTPAVKNSDCAHAETSSCCDNKTRLQPYTFILL